MHSDLLPLLFICAFIADASRRSAPADAAEPRGSDGSCGAGAGGCLPGARRGGQGRAGLMGPHPKRRALLGSLFGPFSHLLGLICRECDSWWAKYWEKWWEAGLIRNGSAFPHRYCPPLHLGSLGSLAVPHGAASTGREPATPSPGPRGTGGCGCFHLPSRQLKSTNVGTWEPRDGLQAARFHLLSHPTLRG